MTDVWTGSPTDRPEVDRRGRFRAPEEPAWSGDPRVSRATGRRARGILLVAATIVVPLISSCSWNTAGSTGCVLDRTPVPLPAGIGESSGLAPASRPAAAGPGDDLLLWTHNDSGSDPVLLAVDLSGRTVDSVRLSTAGGTRFSDLEALERASCPEGECLYVADVGDNEERRGDAAIHRLPEPNVGEGGVEPGARAEARRSGDLDGDGGRGAVPTEILPVRFPDGPTDVEAMFVLPGERIHLVSKGRSRPVTVYRYPLPLRPGRRVTLEAVQTLTREPPLLPAYVTGAATSPDGTIVAIRTYESLEFYRVRDGRLTPRPGGRVVLRSLREAQGEAVAILPDGRVVLGSEAGPLGRRGGLVVLRCPGP